MGNVHSPMNGTAAYTARPGRDKMDLGHEVIRFRHIPVKPLLAGELSLLVPAPPGKLPEAFPSTLPLGAMPRKETVMIELPEEQRKSLQDGAPVRVRENGQEYVLPRPDVYERLSEGQYDDDPWTAAEMDLLREESVRMEEQP
jgi:hypothetical protein